MDWVNFGYDLRTPLSPSSTWKVGSLVFNDFSKLLKSRSHKINHILSFDLNLSPRPDATISNLPGNVDLDYGAYSSPQQPYERYGKCGLSGFLVYWQIEKNAYLRALEENWFSFLPEKLERAPPSWQPIGIDIVNDQGVSEYWDISEDFWFLDSRLADAVNAHGLIEPEDLVAEVLQMLPMDPANRWVMPVRAWIGPS